MAVAASHFPPVTPSARIAISDFAAGTGSFADDLYKERGIVRGRVDLFLRSSEIKPLFYGFSLSLLFFFNFVMAGGSFILLASVALLGGAFGGAWCVVVVVH